MSYSENELIKSLAEILCLALAEVFSENLDRKTLWERIGTGLESSILKSKPGDLHEFLNHCLDHVKASAGQVASNERLIRIIHDFDMLIKQKMERDFMMYIKKYKFLILTKARQTWNMEKEVKHA